MKNKFLLILLILPMSCAIPTSQQKIFITFYKNALQADRVGNSPDAEKNYELALANADYEDLTIHSISRIKNQLGVVKGKLCKYNEAETLLLESLELEEKVTKPSDPYATIPTFNLARLHFDRGQYTDSLQYFERATNIAKKRDVTSKYSDPIGFADALDDYSEALGKSGQPSLAEKFRTESNQVRKNNPGMKSVYSRIKFGEPCLTNPTTIEIKKNHDQKPPRFDLGRRPFSNRNGNVADIALELNGLPAPGQTEFPIRTGKNVIGIKASRSVGHFLTPRTESIVLCLTFMAEENHLYEVFVSQTDWSVLLSSKYDNDKKDWPFKVEKSLKQLYPLCSRG